MSDESNSKKKKKQTISEIMSFTNIFKLTNTTTSTIKKPASQMLLFLFFFQYERFFSFFFTQLKFKVCMIAHKHKTGHDFGDFRRERLEQTAESELILIRLQAQK
jgi:hypothetical protein